MLAALFLCAHLYPIVDVQASEKHTVPSVGPEYQHHRSRQDLQGAPRTGGIFSGAHHFVVNGSIMTDSDTSNNSKGTHFLNRCYAEYSQY